MFADQVLVCPESLRGSADELSSIAQRLAYEAAGPALAVPCEGLLSGAALAELTAAVRHRVDVLAASAVDVAVLVRRVAMDYEAADDRAAGRARAVA